MANAAMNINSSHLNFGQIAAVTVYLKRPIVLKKGKLYLTKETPHLIENVDVTTHLDMHLLLIQEILVIVTLNLTIAVVTYCLVNNWK